VYTTHYNTTNETIEAIADVLSLTTLGHQTTWVGLFSRPPCAHTDCNATQTE